jgi:hypothetical protein
MISKIKNKLANLKINLFKICSLSLTVTIPKKVEDAENNGPSQPEINHTQSQVDRLASLTILERSIDKLIEEARYGDALFEITKFCGGVIVDSAAIGKIYSSRFLDDLCKLVGISSQKVQTLNRKRPSVGTVILVTQLVDTGGHVEVIKDLISLGVLKGPITIFLTGYLTKTEERILNEYRVKFNLDVISMHHEDKNELFLNINRGLSEISPETLVLVSYNHDSFAIAAAYAGHFDNIIFLHHGDHHLCLGAASRDFIHVDLHNCGFHICRNMLGLDNKYWPLTISTENLPKNNNNYKIDSGVKTCTSGRGEKFENIGYRYSYFDFIPKIIQATKGQHIHIGYLSETILNKIYASLHECGINQSSFVYIERVSSLAEKLTELQVDLYIGSFPLGGGKASLEAMAAGIPLLMHVNYLSRSHGGFDLVYKDAFFWETTEEFFHILSDLNSETLLLHSKKSLEHFNKYYTKDVLIKAVSALDEKQDLSCLPPVRNYFPDQIFSYITYRKN